MLTIGGLHFHRHAEIYVGIPVQRFAGDLGTPGAERQAKASSAQLTSFKYYPWALDLGTVRPFVSSGLMLRALSLSDGADPATNPGAQTKYLVPLGLGLGWSFPGGILDLQAQYAFGDHWEVASGLAAQDLAQRAPAYASRWLDLSSIQWTVGIRTNLDPSAAAVEPGFVEAEEARVARRRANGTASTLSVGLGPSARLFANDSTYFSERRPYLGATYTEGTFPHMTLGYRLDPLDAELRLSYRSFAGQAAAYGAQLDTSRSGVMLEAFKLFDPNFYGFVPFVGAGLGYESGTFKDVAAGVTTTASTQRLVPSLIAGWDIRMDPSSAWLLRTNLRWTPSFSIDTGKGSAFDLGGLEYDFIQLVVYPQRLFSK
ncbi:hypothetical protein D3C86_1065980 [compost metagenome]